MNAYEIIFKSGSRVTAYTTSNDPSDGFDDLMFDQVACVVDITDNLKNQKEWLAETSPLRKSLMVRDQIEKDKAQKDYDAQVKAENPLTGLVK